MKLQYCVLDEAKMDLTARVLASPFVGRCRAGKVSLTEMKRYLVQQGLYGAHFTRYLCALMSNLPSNHAVLELAENLFEELGLDPANRSVPHHEIYRDMLARFGLCLEGAQATPGTRLLIDTMLAHCRSTNPAQGLGALCLGAEALVPALYADIILGFKACGVAADDIEFFRIHVDCDDGHAETIREIMLHVAAHDSEQLAAMIDAGSAVVSARLKFFDDLDRPARLVAEPAVSLA